MALLCVVSIEILFRLQQAYGLIYDLEFNSLISPIPSDTLNHAPNTSGSFGGQKFDKLGIGQYSSIERPEICEQLMKI